MKFYSIALPIILLALTCCQAKMKFGAGQNKIPIGCDLLITHNQLRERGELTIKFESNCDSLHVYFPGGGTVTSATLYKDSLRQEEFATTGAFSLMGDGKNKITISKNQKGTYYLVYNSCHWGSRMRLIFE